VEVLAPRSLDEALRLKAERPDSLPIQGGTDVMVELNFDRARPETLLNLNEVGELRGWGRENGMIRLGCRRLRKRRARSAVPRSETAAPSAETSARPLPPATRCPRC
jgi:CO/xanthine dehydrogenase FAD-binding subunit